MRTILVSNTGKWEEKEISRKEITTAFGIHTRDLRPVFTRKPTTAIFPRGKAIIICIRSVKIVIGAKEMMVFNLEKKKIVDYFLPSLVERIQAGKKENIRFEHLVTDSALHYIIEKMQRRFEEIERTNEQIMGKLHTELNDENFEQLLHLKKRLSKLETNVEETEREINELIDDDEDMLEMYLGTRKPSDTEDLESILENIVEQIENISHRVDELNENIDDTQEIITLKMSNLRNAIIKFNLILTAATGILAILAVIVGFYGMNIRNHMENDPLAIWWIGLILLIIFLFGFGGLLTYLKRKKLL
ncbi:CorA family magnesium transporter [Candidatus Gracilibacteria bacterium]|nr:CorA family magnesium transporter [Candidatus Gracilibacteria bacterium]MCF7819076.1 CorA family magnesium transporter [Candidatus Gracilibacteria bacterium]